MCLYFPANFLVISYSCFIFPWAGESSASLARSSMKFSLSVFTLFLTALFASIYSSCAVAFVALVRRLLIAPFFSFPTCTLLTVSAEIQSFCWYFFFSRTSLHVLVHISLICCHCVSMSMFPSSRRSCRTSYLFLLVSRKVSVVTLSFRKSTLYCVLVLLLTSLFFSFVFVLARTRWWSEAGSARLRTLTYCNDLLNFRPMQIWSILFYVRLNGTTHVALLILSLHGVILSPGGSQSPKFCKVPLVDVFATICFYGKGLLALCPTLLLSQPGCDRPWQRLFIHSGHLLLRNRDSIAIEIKLVAVTTFLCGKESMSFIQRAC